MSIPGVQGQVVDGGLGAGTGGGLDTIVVIGPATAGPMGADGGPNAGPGFTTHTSTKSVVALYTSGPAVELACYLLNAIPTPTVLLYRTPNSIAGALGTPDLSGFTGTALPVWSGTPLDASEQLVTFENGGTLGTSGITFDASWDNARTTEPGPTTLLTTQFSYVPAGSGLRLDLNPPAAQITALVTYTNDLRTKILAHFPYTTGSVHGSADTTSDDNVHAAATDLPSAILVLVSLEAALALHFARGSTVHLTADVTTSLTAAAAAATAVTASGLGQDAITLAQLIATAFATHEANTTVHTIADVVNVVTATPPTRGTVVTGDKIYVNVTPPMPSAADISTAITTVTKGLRRFRVMVATGTSTPSDFVTIDNATQAFEANFDYSFVALNTRDYNTGETDVTYVQAMQTLWSTTFAQHLRISLAMAFAKITGAIGAPSEGRQIRRPAMWAAMRRFMEFDPSVDIAEVERGPLAGVSITDSSGNAWEHDERVNGGNGGFNDPPRLLSLCTFKGKSGAYVCIPWMKSAAGSDFIRIHLRAVMDVACAETYDNLLLLLNKGVPVNPKTGFLDPAQANKLAFKTNAALSAALAQKQGSLQRPRSSGGGILDKNGKPIPTQYVALDTSTNLLVPGTTLDVDVSFVPLAYLEAILFRIGFRNPALTAQQGG